MRIAVIDSDSGFIQVLVRRLDDLRWERRVTTGPLPLDTLVATRLDALVVDPEALGHQAWEYLETVIARLPALGIVVVTARSTVAQRVRGLRLGVDDWMTKPCHPEEVVARVEAVVRRRKASEPVAAADAVEAGELEVRPDQFQAFVDGISVELTRREFELLQLLASAEGQVLQREDIYQRVWGYAMAHGDRSVDVFVRKLRAKLERASPAWRYIHTHFGVGYRFAAVPVGGPERSDAQPVPERPLAPMADVRVAA
jgi:DNA-binding response OmpR family regulator